MTPASNRTGTVLLVLACWLLLTPWVVTPWSLRFLLPGLLLALAGYAAFTRRAEVFGAAFFFAVFYIATHLTETLFQVGFAIAIAAYVAALWLLPALRPGDPSWRRGRLDRTVLALTAASVAISGSALVGWYLLLDPDVSDLTSGMFPDGVPIWGLWLGGVAFSLVNACVEEFAYRGVLTSALESARLRPAAVILLQGLSFGILHIHGFPRGWIGVGLATIYGVMMGALRHASGGMLAPWLGHVFTDIAIVSILLFLAM